jgi:integrase
VIREQYDKRNPFAAQGAKHTTKGAIRHMMEEILELAGIRPTTPQEEHEVMLAHGFRKFFNTQLVTVGINPLIKELLMGHEVGLEASYYRPEEAAIEREYRKAIDSLTIDPANRLKREIEYLTVEKNKIDLLEQDLAELRNLITLK